MRHGRPGHKALLIGESFGWQMVSQEIRLEDPNASFGLRSATMQLSMSPILELGLHRLRRSGEGRVADLQVSQGRAIVGR